MEFIFTEPFKKDYVALSSEIRQSFNKAIKFFIVNPRHPSLQTKKLPHTSIWYARLTRGYRFTFEYYKSVVILRRIGTHDILDKERKN